MPMSRNPKGGRPPKLARLRRTQRLHVLLTGAERKTLDRYAKQRNATASEIVRASIRSLLEEESEKGGKL